MKKILLSFTAILFVSSCQTLPYQPYARDVKKKPAQNGVIALKAEHRDEDRAKATVMMQSNCGPTPVKVLEEGEVVIGQESTTNSTTSKNAGESSVSMGSFLGLFDNKWWITSSFSCNWKPRSDYST